MATLPHTQEDEVSPVVNTGEEEEDMRIDAIDYIVYDSTSCERRRHMCKSQRTQAIMSFHAAPVSLVIPSNRTVTIRERDPHFQ